MLAQGHSRKDQVLQHPVAKHIFFLFLYLIYCHTENSISARSVHFGGYPCLEILLASHLNFKIGFLRSF